MKLKRTWFSLEIDIQPGELRRFQQEDGSGSGMFATLFAWLYRWFDFKPIVISKENNVVEKKGSKPSAVKSKKRKTHNES